MHACMRKLINVQFLPRMLSCVQTEFRVLSVNVCSIVQLEIQVKVISSTFLKHQQQNFCFLQLYDFHSR